ncbi:MAG: hypothetical protein J1F14_07920 [Treponema sp.]|nr:hypothetical protein [Treponema sp.]
MDHQTCSELLVLFLLLVSSSRFLFIHKVKADSLSVVPFTAFLITLLLQLAWGISYMSIALACLSFFVSVWNVRATIRFFNGLVIDHYGAGFIVISVINLLLILFMGTLVVYFRPAYTDLEKYGVTVTKTPLCGTFETGFLPVTNPLQRNTAVLFEFAPAKQDRKPAREKHNAAPEDAENVPADGEDFSEPYGQEQTHESPVQDDNPGPKKIILFVPPRTAGVDTYLPFLAKLSHDGFTVYTAEFNSPGTRWFYNGFDLRFIRRFHFLNLRLFDKVFYDSLISAGRDNILKEYDALLNLSGARKEDFVFLATEDDISRSMEDFMSAGTGLVDGCFDTASVPDYTTPGFGPIENTDPLLAAFMGIKRDGTKYMASHIASALEKSFYAAQSIPNAEISVY